MMGRFLLLLLVASAAAASSDSSSDRGRKTRNVEVTADEEKVRDRRGFDAIAEIHREMDDDHSGSIDRAETSGFMAEDMNMRSTERARREKAFHGEDEAITVDDMWELWFESAERSWTSQELSHWVATHVNLPQYSQTIETMKLDGRILPLLAVQNSSSFMTDKLNIKSSVHRQKLRLSALDVVLFGFRENNSRLKDIALALLMIILSAVIGLMVRQKRLARSKLEAYAKQMEELNNMKNDLEDATTKMKQEHARRPTHEGHEVQLLRSQLDEANKKLELSCSGGTAPLILQPLLRKTCEVEFVYLNKQKAECLRAMKAAIEEVDKLRKKQSTLMSSLKLATGASSGSDSIDANIFTLKNRMEAIQSSTREATERWMEIEALAGFPILYVNETTSTTTQGRSKASVAGSAASQQAPSFYRGPGSGSSSSVSSMERGATAAMTSLPHSASAPIQHMERVNFIAAPPLSSHSSPAAVAANNNHIPHAETAPTRQLVRDVDVMSVSSGETQNGTVKRRKRDVLKSIFTRNKNKAV